MNKQTEPTASVVVDIQTMEHAAKAGLAENAIIADMKRLGGMADKTFRTSFMIGRIAAKLAKDTVNQAVFDAAMALYGKANPDAKGDKAKRTKAEQAIYNASKVALSDFCRRHGLTPAQQRAKAKQNEAKKAAKATTPTANNAASADKYLRTQCAAMLAYADKNKALVPDAMRHALLELAEAFNAVPIAEAETEAAE